MSDTPQPTKRELEILRVLWRLGEGTVREIYEEFRKAGLPIVQNTVQAFLRTMEQKGLVRHRVRGRAFVYCPTAPREQTGRRMATRLLETVFDGAIDQLVDSLFSSRAPSAAELDRLERLIDSVRAEQPRSPE